MTVYKVLICDDHAVVRAGLHLILEKEKDFQIVGEAANTEQAIEQAMSLRPDIVLMDISMPGMNGLDAITRLRAVAPEAKVLILTVHNDEAYFFRALEAGAAGYVLKGASVNGLLAAIQLVVHGGVPIPHNLAPALLVDYLEQVENGRIPSYKRLSSREREVLRHIAEGHPNKAIAEQLSISVRTVERQRSSIMHKIGLQSRAELLAYAVRQGLLSGGDIQHS